MKILAHRGCWVDAIEKNTFRALERAFKSGFGIETDLRDHDGVIVLSHDPPTSAGNYLKLSELLTLARAHPGNPLALNIKSDGLAPYIHEALEEHGSSNLYFFDMSVPDQQSYLNTGLPTFSRMSEFESEVPEGVQADGIWLDSFGDEWWTESLLMSLLEKFKQVCVVSSELHGRNPEQLWEKLHGIAHLPNLQLCTDSPDLAREFFYAG